MGIVFVSYSSADSDWADWIGTELKAAGHQPRLFRWELGPGDDIIQWMTKTLQVSDHVISIATPHYFKGLWSEKEYNAALQRGIRERKSVLWPVLVEPCQVPDLWQMLNSCYLYKYANEEDARAQFHAFIGGPAKPPEKRVFFPGAQMADTNIHYRAPRHFLGRENLLNKIGAALTPSGGLPAAIALTGMPGVGKSTVALVFAERHRKTYRATWQIRAESPATMAADLLALGARLGWIRADDGGSNAVSHNVVLERLCDNGRGILLIYDNAIDAENLTPFLPSSGEAHVIITSNANAWNAIATKIEVKLWPEDVAVEFLLARSARSDERAGAKELAKRLGYLPLAMEVAAAHCEELKGPLAQYKEQIDELPVPRSYRARRDLNTVSAVFELAIQEAEKRHPAAGALIEYIALLAPEPVPLFIIERAADKLGAPLSTLVGRDNLIEVIKALLTFAVVDRVQVPDERDSAVSTDCIQLHRIVRDIAVRRLPEVSRVAATRNLIAALEAAFPTDDGLDLTSWPTARRLDAHAWELIGADRMLPAGSEIVASDLMEKLAAHRDAASPVHRQILPLIERACAIRREVFGDRSAPFATSLLQFARFYLGQGDRLKALRFAKDAFTCRREIEPNNKIAIAEAELTVASVLRYAKRIKVARKYCDFALAKYENSTESLELAYCLSVSARIATAAGDDETAQARFERALSIYESKLGADHPATGTSLINLAGFRERDGDYSAARALIERALKIHISRFGEGHRLVAYACARLGGVNELDGDIGQAIAPFEKAVAINSREMPPNHAEVVWAKTRLDALRRGEVRRFKPRSVTATAGWVK